MLPDKSQSLSISPLELKEASAVPVEERDINLELKSPRVLVRSPMIEIDPNRSASNVPVPIFFAVNELRIPPIDISVELNESALMVVDEVGEPPLSIFILLRFLIVSAFNSFCIFIVPLFSMFTSGLTIDTGPGPFTLIPPN
jgi:hypothetical protein